MLIALSALIGIGVVSLSHAPTGRVYTVLEVLDNLNKHPRAWIGRTVYMHGIARLNSNGTIDLIEDLPWTTQNTGNAITEMWVSLTVTSSPINPTYASLTWVPKLVGLLPWTDQQEPQEHEQVYHVQLVPGVCHRSGCAQGHLV